MCEFLFIVCEYHKKYVYIHTHTHTKERPGTRKKLNDFFVCFGGGKEKKRVQKKPGSRRGRERGSNTLTSHPSFSRILRECVCERERECVRIRVICIVCVLLHPNVTS